MSCAGWPAVSPLPLLVPDLAVVLSAAYVTMVAMQSARMQS